MCEPYTSLADLSQNLVTCRRQIQWKINFGFWTVFGLFAYYALPEIKGLWGTYGLIVGTVILFIGAALHVYDVVGTVIPNQKDMDWITYCREKALLVAKDPCVDEDIVSDHKEKVKDTRLSIWPFLRKRKCDMWFRLTPSIAVTVMLLIVCLVILWREKPVRPRTQVSKGIPMGFTSRCPNPGCSGAGFEVAKADIQGTEYKVYSVQCDRCGTTISTMTYYDPGVLGKDNEVRLQKIEKQLHQIGSQLSDVQSLLRNR